MVLQTDSWYVTGFVHNLADEDYDLAYGFGEANPNPSLATRGQPRTYGLTVGVNF